MRVAVIGASAHREKYGNKAVRSYVAQDHEVLPVNPHLEEVEGLKAYARITDIPGDIDRALREGTPEEYEELVRDYFRAISEADGSPAPSAEPLP